MEFAIKRVRRRPGGQSKDKSCTHLRPKERSDFSQTDHVDPKSRPKDGR